MGSRRTLTARLESCSTASASTHTCSTERTPRTPFKGALLLASAATSPSSTATNVTVSPATVCQATSPRGRLTQTVAANRQPLLWRASGTWTGLPVLLLRQPLPLEHSPWPRQVSVATVGLGCDCCRLRGSTAAANSTYHGAESFDAGFIYVK